MTGTGNNDALVSFQENVNEMLFKETRGGLPTKRTITQVLQSHYVLCQK